MICASTQDLDFALVAKKANDLMTELKSRVDSITRRGAFEELDDEQGLKFTAAFIRGFYMLKIRQLYFLDDRDSLFAILYVSEQLGFNEYPI